MHPLNQFKKAGGAYVTRDELEAALAPILAALEVSEPVEEPIVDVSISGNPTSRLEPAPAVKPLDPAESTKEALSGSDKEAHPAESDPEGLELVEKIHERKSSSRKRKPENQDPLGLVPDVEED